MGRRWVALAAVLGLSACASDAFRAGRDIHDCRPTHIVASAAAAPEAVTQIFAARGFEPFSKPFAVHTWIAYKRPDDNAYTVLDARGWKPYDGDLTPALRRRTRQHSDFRWHGAAPELLFETKGETASRAIVQIERALESYPKRYVVWPGPNSNSLTAHVVRKSPDIVMELPPTAIGKDYLPGAIFARTPSRTGVQISFGGYLGVMLGIEEGIELSLLGLVFGVDFLPPALKLPVVGRVGFPQRKVAANPEGTAPPSGEDKCKWD